MNRHACRRGLLVLALLSAPCLPLVRPAPAQAAGLSVSVAGKTLVGADGAPLRLLGVNRSGPDFACAFGTGIFNGPDDAASVAAMSTWYINAVRLPLNEDCWLGINGIDPAYSGDNYRQAIVNYVGLLHRYGLYAVLALQRNAHGALLARGNVAQPMADMDHSPAFWSSVATTFRDDHAVLLDLFGQPHDVSWPCWLSGCQVANDDGLWQAAGMQQLLDAVRATGARQPVLASGNAWGNGLDAWLAWEPHDPAGQLVVGLHMYSENLCNTQFCWDSTVAPLAARLPVVVTEFGENDCAAAFVNEFMAWADAQGISYLAWTWNDWDCRTPALIATYAGVPTRFGSAVRAHLTDLATLSRAAAQPETDGASTPPAQPSPGAAVQGPVATVVRQATVPFDSGAVIVGAAALAMIGGILAAVRRYRRHTLTARGRTHAGGPA